MATTDNITFLSAKNYFEDLAQRNKLIQHNEAGEKRFSFSTIAAFVMDTVIKTKPTDGRCIMHLIRPDRSVNFNGSSTNDHHRVMFFVLAPVIGKNENKEVEAIDLAEKAINQILTRIRFDSNNGHTFWNRSQDQLKDVKISPYDITTSGCVWSGFQVSIAPPQKFTKCYNENDWLL